MGREGDGIVARGVAGEGARVEVEHTISSAWTVGVVEVGEEGFKFHCSGRFDLSGPPGTYLIFVISFTQPQFDAWKFYT